jgi:hypothetical protein
MSTGKLLTALAVTAIVIMGVCGITMSIRQSTAFVDDCEAAGGHIVDTHICVSPDGRIIDIPLRY